MSKKGVPKFETNKASIMSPEEIKLNDYYTLTLNPNDRHQYFEDPKRIDKLTTFVECLILECPNMDINIHMEISRKGRLHFHGIIKFCKIEHVLYFYLNKINEWLSYFQIEMDTIADLDVWNKYCIKSNHLINVNINSKDVLEKSKLLKKKKNGDYDIVYKHTF